MESFGKPQTRRKKRIAKRRILNLTAFNEILRRIVGPFLRWRFNVKAENAQLVRSIRPPYLLLPNHSSVLDPFFVGMFARGVIHYVVSDANFRSPIVNFGLSLVGSIPKTKAMTDMDSIKTIMRVTKNGGIVGIFPEGQSTWDGHSLPLFYSTAKLIKVLRVPVVVARLSGAFLSLPRWSRSRRKGQVTVRFHLAFTKEELQAAKVEEIDDKVNKLLEHDDFEYNRKVKRKYYGKNRAEYCEIALFICPECKTISSLRSHGNLLSCVHCGYTVRYTLYGFFQAKRGELYFDNMHDWNVWQREELRRQMAAYAEGDENEPLLVEPEVEIRTGYKALPLRELITGRLEFHRDKLVATSGDGSVISLPISEIRGINVQNRERLEFYVGDNLYRIVTTDPRGCTYKWDLAVTFMQEINRKLAPSEGARQA